MEFVFEASFERLHIFFYAHKYPYISLEIVHAKENYNLCVVW